MIATLDVLLFAKHFHSFLLSNLEIVLGQFDTLWLYEESSVFRVEDILEILSYNLRKEGFEVEKATDGISALKKAKKFIPDLIILDVMMPNMDGM